MKRLDFVHKGLCKGFCAGLALIIASLFLFSCEGHAEVNDTLVPVTGAISGRVFNKETGKILPNVTVTLRKNGVIVRTTQTNARGEYQFTLVTRYTQTGYGMFKWLSYTVTVREEGYKAYASNPIIFSSTKRYITHNIGLEPLLSPTVNIQGHVYGVYLDGSELLEGATVILTPHAIGYGACLRTITTNADGKYVINNVPRYVQTSGGAITWIRYTISASHEGFESFESPEMVFDGEGNKPYYIIDENNISYDIRLRYIWWNEGTISGYIFDATTDELLAGVTVILKNQTYYGYSALDHSTVTDEDGYYEFADVRKYVQSSGGQTTWIRYTLNISAEGYQNYEGRELQFSEDVHDFTIDIALERQFSTRNSQELQDLVDSSYIGDERYIGPGTYVFSSDLAIDKDITLKVIDPENTTLILGDYHILIKEVEGEEKIENATIEGVTIRDYSGKDEKGPIQNYAKNLTLRNCKVLNNKGLRASAIYTSYGTNLNLDNTLIANNTNTQENIEEPDKISSWKKRYRGAIYLSGRAELNMRNSTLAGNTNGYESIEETGGIVKYGAIQRSWLNNVNIEDSIMWDNKEANDISCMIKCWQKRYLTNSDIQQKDIPGTGKVEGVISVDPEFIDPANDDYNVSNNSPCSTRKIGIIRR